MELDERKTKILEAIIRNYLETGEPVGSRTISKFTDLNLSSATIRNEMSDLEEMGYILQPHTSAGRIPSDKGYRFYVDRIMDDKEREVSEIKELMIERQDKMELLLKQVVKVLATNTNYAAMVSAPSYHRNKVKFLQLSQVDEKQLVAVVVVEGNIVKNKIIDVSEVLDNAPETEYAFEYQFKWSESGRNQLRNDYKIKGTGRNSQQYCKRSVRCCCRSNQGGR